MKSEILSHASVECRKDDSLSKFHIPKISPEMGIVKQVSMENNLNFSQVVVFHLQVNKERPERKKMQNITI